MRESEFLQCPLCGWVRPLNYGWSKEGEWREVRFDKVDPSRVLVWQKKELGSKGKGKGIIRLVEGLKLNQLPEDLKVQIKEQARKILNEIEEK